MNITSKFLKGLRFFILFIVAIVFSAMFFIPLDLFATAVESPLQQFPDVPINHPFAKTVSDFKEKGYVKGYPDGTFAPDSSVTRAEFVTMLLATTGRPTVNLKNCFKDVKDEWFAPFVCAAKKKGLVKGYANGTFGPHKNINFAEASAMIAQAYGLNPRKASGGELWYKPAVNKLAAKAAIPVTIDFPEKKMSRGETAEMLWRLKTKTTDKPTKTFKNLTAEFPNLGSCDELKEKLQLYRYKQGYGRGYAYMKTMGPAPAGRMEVMEMQAEAAGEEEEAEAMEETAETSAPASAPPGSPDYSTTNVQVEGVDEADVIKNDGEFIYIVNGNTVRIVKAYPPENMAEVSKFEFSDKNFRPSDIYVEGNKLVVLGSTGQKTEMIVLDISNRSAPNEERLLYFDGDQISSRRIGNLVYLVLRNTPNYYDIQPLPSEPESDDGAEVQKILPRFFDSRAMESDKPIAPCSKIKFLPKYDEPNFLAIVSVDIKNPEKQVGREVIMGAGETVYASPESLYVAATRYDVPETEQFDVWQPPSYGQEKTVFHRFSLANGEVKFKTKGELAGHLLNQFSMDEYGNTFRVATTVERGNGPSQNHLFVLDRDNLAAVLGKIENIATGEKIYSVRFLGKRAYLVTFKYIDPFFVIDLEDPANPKILGELKIPGYSDYLHPYDENHIIGFGKQVDPSIDADKVHSDNAVYYTAVQGMKIALFDVTDVANPRALFTEIIGDRGTESELLRNHKALLFDRSRNLLAFPVQVAEIKNKNPDEWYSGIEGQIVFRGAYVYSLDLENGFQKKGEITHYDEGIPQQCQQFGDFDMMPMPIGQVQCWSRLDYTKDIQRIIRIGDFLYTISPGKVKAVKREDVSEVKALPLEAPEGGSPVIIY